MKKHEWRQRGDDGEERYVRAVSHGGVWRVAVRDAGGDGWTYLDPIPLPVLEQLRQRLWDKYQRRRLPWGDVEAVDRLIERHRP